MDNLKYSDLFEIYKSININLPRDIYKYIDSIAKSKNKSVDKFILDLLKILLPDKLEDIIGREKYDKIISATLKNEKYLSSKDKEIISGEQLAEYIFGQPRSLNIDKIKSFIDTVNFNPSFLEHLNYDLKSNLSVNNELTPSKFKLYRIKKRIYKDSNNQKVDYYKIKLAFRINDKYYFEGVEHDKDTITVINSIDSKSFLSRVFNNNKKYERLSELIEIICFYIDMICESLNDYINSINSKLDINLNSEKLFIPLEKVRNGKFLCNLGIDEIKIIFKEALNNYWNTINTYAKQLYDNNEFLLNLKRPFVVFMSVFNKV